MIAPDKFKGSLSALDAADAIERGVRRIDRRAATLLCPMADGGEGTVASFLDAGAQRHERSVRGPLGEPVRAVFAVDSATAIIEMATASGQALLSPERYDPLVATTYGTGELIRAALDLGATTIVVGIGGSATNDGGTGMLEALGARFYDSEGALFSPTPATLQRLERLDVSGLDRRLREVRVQVASDVDNPLCGATGASAVFGPQKGAGPEAVAILDAALAHFADVTRAALGRELRDVPGAGAAGGIGFALVAYLTAELRPGVEIVAELRGLPGLLAGADYCLTGEGRLDVQTLHGKTVAGVAAFAAARGVPVIAFGGTVDPVEEALFERGIVCFPIATGPLSLAEAVAGASRLLEDAAARFARTAELLRVPPPASGLR